MGRSVRSPQDVAVWCVRAIRPFCPGVRTMVILLLGLQSIAVGLMVNTAVALSVITVLAVGVIKIYRVRTEPILLLSAHFALTCWMLYDSTSTVMVLVAFLAALVGCGDWDLSAERVTLLLATLLGHWVFSKPIALVCGLAVGVVLTKLKLRQVRPASVALLALSVLGWAVVLGALCGTLLTLLYMAVVVALFGLDRFADSERFLAMSKHRSVAHSNCNGSLTSGNGTAAFSTLLNKPIPSGYIKLSNATESLDLHGHTVTGAMAVLHKYLRESEDAYRNNRADHMRHVTIVVGEGDHEDERSSGPLLKPTVLNYLKINKYRYEVSRENPGLIQVDLESHVF